MTVCAECGKENDSAVDECAGCGAPIEPMEARSVMGSLVLGVYRIVEVLGQGGMSVVYKAQHRMTGHTVALKILPEEIAVHEDITARFIEEAKALAQLEHPGIVRLNHFGEERGRFVLVMQYVEGKTFEKLIFQANQLPWRLATDVTVQVLDALAYAHGRGVVHRDIKPSNIFVRTDGTAMLMDFGIAKMREGSARLTATGQTMGTVRYMSPEQVRGKVVDARTDIYSLGVALYEALTGDTPFDGQTHFEIMMKHLQEAPPPLRARGAAAPDAVGKAIARAMAKDVAKRYQTAAEMARELEAAFTGDEERRRAHEDVGVLVRGEPPPLELRPPPTRDDQTSPGAPTAAGTSFTDLADKLEPEPAPERPRRVRWAGWAAVAAAVAVAAVATLVFVRQPTGVPADAPRPDVSAPFLVTGMSPAIDVTFGAPDYVRIVATRQIDVHHLRRSFAQARNRFEDYLRARKIGGAVEVHPVTLVVAPSAVLCHRDLYDKGAVPADCAERPPRFKYPLKRSTLYVNDNENLDEVNLVEGASVHFCSTSPALLELGCGKNLLPPFWDDVEKVIR